jgi:O-antigen/teichoic acid export membrane protein
MASSNFRLNSVLALTAKLGGAAATLLTTMLLARLLSKPDFAGYVIIGAVASHTHQ